MTEIRRERERERENGALRPLDEGQTMLRYVRAGMSRRGLCPASACG